MHRPLDCTFGMRCFRLCATLIAIAALAAAGTTLSASALETGRQQEVATIEPGATPQQDGASDSDALTRRALWAVVGVAIGSTVFGGFYLARRRAGHFDNPTWTAPISKMYSKDFPESFGDAPADPHDGHH